MVRVARIVPVAPHARQEHGRRRARRPTGTKGQVGGPPPRRSCQPSSWLLHTAPAGGPSGRERSPGPQQPSQLGGIFGRPGLSHRSATLARSLSPSPSAVASRLPAAQQTAALDPPDAVSNPGSRRHTIRSAGAQVCRSAGISDPTSSYGPIWTDRRPAPASGPAMPRPDGRPRWRGSAPRRRRRTSCPTSHQRRVCSVARGPAPASRRALLAPPGQDGVTSHAERPVADRPRPGRRRWRLAAMRRRAENSSWAAPGAARRAPPPTFAASGRRGVRRSARSSCPSRPGRWPPGRGRRRGSRLSARAGAATSNASSSGRLRTSTACTSSSASRRAARPATA